MLKQGNNAKISKSIGSKKAIKAKLWEVKRGDLGEKKED